MALMEVPQPGEPVTPVVPDAPVTPAVPDPGTPGAPEEPATVPVPEEPATPIDPDPGPAPEPEPDPGPAPEPQPSPSTPDPGEARISARAIGHRADHDVWLEERRARVQGGPVVDEGSERSPEQG
jgi:hypothetical protein